MVGALPDGDGEVRPVDGAWGDVPTRLGEDCSNGATEACSIFRSAAVQLRNKGRAGEHAGEEQRSQYSIRWALGPLQWTESEVWTNTEGKHSL